MRRILVLLALCAAAPILSAETVSLGAHGSLALTVPKGWTLSSQKEQDSGLAITLSPQSDANAKAIINVTFIADPQPVGRAEVEEKVRTIGEQFVDASVEKKETLRDLPAGGGAIGSYCVFTDASMVGQPPKKDEFKVIAVGIIRFTDDVMAAFSLAADSEKGPEFTALVSALSSAVYTPARHAP
ncbi:MAG TPA: hypothetical protein VGG37_05250 [Opitutaceae bacterium]|jgi:hypothetical protein